MAAVEMHFFSKKRTFAAGLFCAVLAAYAWMATGGQLPHSHSALESEEKCPLHFFAKQAQGQSFTPPAPVFVLRFVSELIPFCEGMTAGTVLVPGPSRAPPLF